MDVIQTLNLLANVVTSLALLAGALPLLLRSIRELVQLRLEMKAVHDIVDRRSKDNDF